jgi:dihydroxy-acid dehydratase
MVNCDKSIAAAMMGAASADLPAIILSGGPMLNGRYRDQTLGACTDCRRLTAQNQVGELSNDTYREIEDGIVRSAGHCMVMGTASTMNSICEAIGIALPGNGAIPAVDSRRLRLAESVGRRIVTLAQQGVRPSQILTKDAFHNAITFMCAVGGSTNAFIHLAAVAGRLGIDLPLYIFDEISRKSPLIASLRPAGKYQMEDLFYAGGIPAILKELLPLLHGDAITVTGKTLAENVRNAVVYDRRIIHPLSEPISPEGGLAVLKGNLAPDGAVIKHAAASPNLLKHRGRAVVFKNMADLTARINDPDLDVLENDILILQNVGPIGAPGMPEVGNFPIPGKLLSQGVRDMIRISDARMSGTAFGTIVLHVAPESAIGGPLALVMDGDEIELDVPNRNISLHVSDQELVLRRARWQSPAAKFERGYGRMYIDHVLQAPQGCDFDFLVGATPVTASEQPKF